MAKILIKQIRSSIGRKSYQKKNLRALGLRGINKVVERENNPCILGMVDKVKHLVSVEDKR